MKPSMEGNSEVSAVCLEYKGRKLMESCLEVLREHFGSTLRAKNMFPRASILRHFLDQLYEYTAMLKIFQN
jgi:hypothetical protein